MKYFLWIILSVVCIASLNWFIESTYIQFGSEGVMGFWMGSLVLVHHLTKS